MMWVISSGAGASMTVNIRLSLSASAAPARQANSGSGTSDSMDFGNPTRMGLIGSGANSVPGVLAGFEGVAVGAAVACGAGERAGVAVGPVVSALDSMRPGTVVVVSPPSSVAGTPSPVGPGSGVWSEQAVRAVRITKTVTKTKGLIRSVPQDCRCPSPRLGLLCLFR